MTPRLRYEFLSVFAPQFHTTSCSKRAGIMKINYEKISLCGVTTVYPYVRYCLEFYIQIDWQIATKSAQSFIYFSKACQVNSLIFINFQRAWHLSKVQLACSNWIAEYLIFSPRQSIRKILLNMVIPVEILLFTVHSIWCSFPIINFKRKLDFIHIVTYWFKLLKMEILLCEFFGINKISCLLTIELSITKCRMRLEFNKGNYSFFCNRKNKLAIYWLFHYKFDITNAIVQRLQDTW